MDHPCPGDWQYERHPKKKKVAERSAALVQRLHAKKVDGLAIAKDSRVAHGDLFRDLTPPHFTYFAGHYRGEPYRCLQTYEVGAGGDPRVGAPAADVARRTTELADLIDKAIQTADTTVKSATMSETDEVLHVVGIACQVFDLFLQVHPYANGNGHVARFIMWALLGRYGFWPVRWPIEPRLKDPEYISMLLRHRNGDRRPFIDHVFNCID